MTEPAAPNFEEQNNSLGALAAVFGGVNSVFGTQVSQTTTMMINVRANLITNNPQLLSQSYVEHGIIQTLVDQPVEDAFRPWFDIRTDQLSPEEIEQLHIFLEKHRVVASLMQAAKWARLLGGGAVMLITGQKSDMPFNPKELRDGSPVEFRAVDQSELYSDKGTGTGQYAVNEDYGSLLGDFFMYYGVRVHKSRVLMVKGKEAPARIRSQLKGWGMSEVERLVRSFNKYLKNGNLIFELMDEAKIDIYKMDGFNNALATLQGAEVVSKRIQHANTIKNYNNALTMDVKDEYDQKQITFSGLAEILRQIREDIASDVKFPVTKLFGTSPGGLNATGESDMENYNSMVETEVRGKIKYHLIELIGYSCQYLFGMIPSDLMVRWHPLRIMSPEQEEKVKDSKFSRVERGYKLGLVSATEAKQSMNKDGLIGVDVDENSEALPLPGQSDNNSDDEETEDAS